MLQTWPNLEAQGVDKRGTKLDKRGLWMTNWQRGIGQYFSKFSAFRSIHAIEEITGEGFRPFREQQIHALPHNFRQMSGVKLKKIGAIMNIRPFPLVCPHYILQHSIGWSGQVMEHSLMFLPNFPQCRHQSVVAFAVHKNGP